MPIKSSIHTALFDYSLIILISLSPVYLLSILYSICLYFYIQYFIISLVKKIHFIIGRELYLPNNVYERKRTQVLQIRSGNI